MYEARSKLDLMLSGSWRLPGVLCVLAADHSALFVAKTPVPKLLARILSRRPRAPFHPPTAAERHSLGLLWRLSSLCLRRLFFTSKPCLRRCLLLLRWCRTWGVDASLVIGVAKDGAELKGHSWIELGGVPFHETSAAIAGYEPMISASSRSGITLHSSHQSDRCHGFPLC